MCQRRQNSLKDFERYGLLKFSGRLNPKSIPIPIAMSQ